MNFSKILVCCLLISIITCTFASAAESLPESDHPYANHFEHTWPAISESGATQMRLHFTKLDIASDHVDKVTLLDKDGNVLATYDDEYNSDDFWADWYTGDTIKVKFTTNGYNTAYGFKIDNVETRPEKPNPPVAAFSASPTSGNVPLNVTFTDKSTGTPTSWKWSFGDGTNSTVQNPTHKYTKAGTYTVALDSKQCWR